MSKILWVKFGWSEFYRGGPVDGNFSWVADGNEGAEAFNFEPASDGTYYCYTPPQSGHYQPSSDDPVGWTVVCLSKDPDRAGIHVVGWYENATLKGRYEKRPGSGLVGEPSQDGRSGGIYSIESREAYFVPLEARTRPFSHPSVGRGKYSLLKGPGVESNANKTAVLKILKERLRHFRGIAVANPSETTLPDPELNPGDPLIGFGTAEHRKLVELAAETEVVEYYKKKDFTKKRVADTPCGFDYVFTKGQTVHHVEVKGTSGSVERFFLTKNENKRRGDPEWRLGMVTDALTSSPTVKIYDNEKLEAAFGLEPYVFIGTRLVDPGNT